MSPAERGPAVRRVLGSTLNNATHHRRVTEPRLAVFPDNSQGVVGVSEASEGSRRRGGAARVDRRGAPTCPFSTPRAHPSTVPRASNHGADRRRLVRRGSGGGG